MNKSLITIVVLSFLINGCSLLKKDFAYESTTLQIQKLTSNVYIHTSFLKTENFGKVSCNGMVVFDKKEAIVFDTPIDEAVSEELISWVENNKKSTINAVVVTHFHVDCLGGLSVFHEQGIASYSNAMTVELAEADGVVTPQNEFEGLLQLPVGQETVICAYLGEGHTKDNIVGYFPSEAVLFGGCMVKEVGASKGNLADATVGEWSATVARVKSKFSNAEYVIPGHGESGGIELLDFTIDLFDEE